MSRPHPDPGSLERENEDLRAQLGEVTARAARAASEADARLEALRQSEAKFKTAFLTSVDACYIGTLHDGRILEINAAFEGLFGYSREEAIGRTSQELGLWVDYGDRLRMRERLLSVGFVKEMETRGRRKGGAQFECSVSTTALHLLGVECVIGVVRDETERKHTEQALRDLTGRLIEAQETERARLARQLHDDFSQRLALLAVNLHLLRGALPETAAKLREAVNGLHAGVQELARDVRRMSQDLHPARLEQLGLVSAVRGLCADLSASRGLPIRCDARDVPLDLPGDVALCLYRVAQEALQNVIRHASAGSALVELTGGTEDVRLAVTDDGRGFDPAATRRKDALGLANMRERMRSISGRLTIESRPGRGTRVEVRAPLGPTKNG